jgi:hypothetical protein
MAEGITNSSDTLNILQKIYSVGSLYFNTADIDPATIFGFGTWERVAKDMALWGASANGQGGTTKAAGLPNITGGMGNSRMFGNDTRNTLGNISQQIGAIKTNAFCHSIASPTGYAAGNGAAVQNGGQIVVSPEVDASKSNPIYGASTTVQPPAFVVNIWRRTA